MRRQESCHVHHTHRLQAAQHRSLLSGQARAREEKDLHGIGVLLFVRCAGSDQAYQDRGQRRHEGCERRHALLLRIPAMPQQHDEQDAGTQRGSMSVTQKLCSCCRDGFRDDQT